MTLKPGVVEILKKSSHTPLYIKEGVLCVQFADSLLIRNFPQ